MSPPPVPAYLPQLLQLVDLLGGDLTRPQLLLLGRDLHQPGQKAAVLDQRLPLRAVPVDVLQATLAGAGLPARRHGLISKQNFYLHDRETDKVLSTEQGAPSEEQNHHRIGLGRDEAQEEDVAAATVVTLQHRLAQRPVFVQRHLFAFGPHQLSSASSWLALATESSTPPLRRRPSSGPFTCERDGSRYETNRTWLWVWPWVCVWLGRVKSVKSYSEPWVSAPSSSVSSVSRKVSVWELGPYASTLIARLNFRFFARAAFPVFGPER
ncbi:hypothetical protein EYF80_047098 [Liparis tanakae]|uniref:Uncharacterized protein n=1 Tax=Liparis tanakae TaxID=230148 RepID=A0A4Z2FP78_9TELE|nr:hypothetical protein EYF80_047098 [Liparis tanakae]